ncbi:DUF4446 family protein [Thermanaerosceptrum fracticalcis]|uniref:DUF4446 family protein n=1 Tax=Thermanaerosceptrum fracticalcis TaxID=1712410 RepID=A0A7G6E555_THEFR|nr:DUF4446 family protein [Thermanaerosceptrum fracticalcis]QNB47209.1 DUF4446 family protein [Thermanaerosceptrum fracticalcis]
MEALLNWVSQNYSLIVLGLLGAFALGLIIFLLVIIRLNKLAKQYKILMRGVEGKNLEELMWNNANTLEQVLFKLDIQEDRLSTVETMAKNSVQKVGIVRFNAFRDMGGDLSYAIALLNSQGDGVVISSIYGRDDARTYAKPVKGGKSSYQLSQEEEEAIAKAARGEK